MADIFADVILPLPIPGNLTYHIPENLEKLAFPGMRVIITLGKNKKSAAIISAVHHTQPRGFTVKDIDSIPDEKPVIHPVNLELWRWISRYYMCPLGDILKAALPAGIKLDRYKPRMRAQVVLHPDMSSADTYYETLSLIKLTVKQKALLTRFAEKTAIFTPVQKPGILKNELLISGKFSESSLKQLITKNILAVRQVNVSRLVQQNNEQASISQLSGPQQEAFEEVKKQFTNKQVVLLHGVTASGKTEIYIHLIREILKTGKQVLYLVPEIALTPQIEHRLVQVFGDIIGMYHSKMSDDERIETWNEVYQPGKDSDYSCQVILGTRSSVFLPFSRLGLIIVDEEHDSSFKQSEPSPRYNARDMAVVLGSQHMCPVLLGSATPSYESFFNAQTGKYGLVSLSRRFGKAPLPDIVIADMRRAWKRREMHSVLTPELFSGMEEALHSGEQIILFQNRRGYSSFLECTDCGHIPVCPNCDVSLTCHLNVHRLICHYCGYKTEIPGTCQACGSTEIKNRGLGTEKAESEISALFPNARISRMDMDTTQSKTSFTRIIKDLEQGKTDILIGTQMVTKGLDVENISLVGVLNADILLNFPDFRSYERAFQLLHQVSGRSGRFSKQGKVIIQTSHPEHPVFRFIQEQDYKGLFNSLIAERKLFRYPPWFRFIKIILKHKNSGYIESVSARFAEKLRKFPFFNVLGPESPVIGKINQWFIKEIWLKFPRDLKSAQLQDAILDVTEKIRHLPGNSGLIIQTDVDPL
jgi:primosomal protein N' (replication factor Y) (superfamily II helicase)